MFGFLACLYQRSSLGLICTSSSFTFQPMQCKDIYLLCYVYCVLFSGCMIMLLIIKCSLHRYLSVYREKAQIAICILTVHQHFSNKDVCKIYEDKRNTSLQHAKHMEETQIFGVNKSTCWFHSLAISILMYTFFIFNKMAEKKWYCVIVNMQTQR